MALSKPRRRMNGDQVKRMKGTIGNCRVVGLEKWYGLKMTGSNMEDKEQCVKD